MVSRGHPILLSIADAYCVASVRVLPQTHQHSYTQGWDIMHTAGWHLWRAQD